MEVKDAEKIVIAKPVALRPTCSSFRPFSELLASAINTSPTKTCYETAVTAIRPRTIRFKPAGNHALAGMVSPQAKLSGDPVHCPYDKVLKSDRTFNVVYKPMAKLVSKTTVSLLANLKSTHLVQKPNLVNYEPDLRPEHHQKFLPQFEKETNIEQVIEADQRSLSHTTNGERPSYDGYNWRKYGQKQVKGSEYPRSYYKCTHPNCPMKKKVERSLDGQIAEIVYKGEHSHPKPQPQKRNSSDGQWQGNGSESHNPLWSNQLRDGNEGHEDNTEYRNEFGLSAHSSYSSRTPSFLDPITTRASGLGVTNCTGYSWELEEGRAGMEVESNETKSKRRKNESHSELDTSGEGTQEPPSVIQKSIDSEVIRDGFRWRKYGQKVVKRNPYPRSYYRCTSLKCNVRKYVERTSDDPTSFITTYEGKHNHEMPIRSTHSAAARTNSKATQNIS